MSEDPLEKVEVASMASEPPVNVDEIFESLHTNMSWLVQGSKQHSQRIAENSDLAKAAATAEALADVKEALTKQSEEAMVAMQASFDEKTKQMEEASDVKLDAALRKLEWNMQEQVQQRVAPMEAGLKEMKDRLSNAEQALSQLVNMPTEERFNQLDKDHDGTITKAALTLACLAIRPPSPSIWSPAAIFLTPLSLSFDRRSLRRLPKSSTQLLLPNPSIRR